MIRVVLVYLIEKLHFQLLCLLISLVRKAKRLHETIVSAKIICDGVFLILSLLFVEI